MCNIIRHACVYCDTRMLKIQRVVTLCVTMHEIYVVTIDAQ